MSDTAAIERPDTLYVTDAELIRRIGVPEKIARDAIRALDSNPRSGFPQKRDKPGRNIKTASGSTTCWHSGRVAPVIDPANRGLARGGAAGRARIAFSRKGWMI